MALLSDLLPTIFPVTKDVVNLQDTETMILLWTLQAVLLNMSSQLTRIKSELTLLAYKFVNTVQYKSSGILIANFGKNRQAFFGIC